MEIGGGRGSEMPMIVVGVDGSDSAQEALRFAVREARLRGSAVRAVMASNITTTAYAGIGGFGPDADPTKLEETARTVLDEAVDSVAEGCDVEIDRVLDVGQPVQVLIEESRDAELLVVGSRGRGGFAGMLLGSVSHQCAMHAHCPVVIVRPTVTGGPDASRAVELDRDAPLHTGGPQ